MAGLARPLVGDAEPPPRRAWLGRPPPAEPHCRAVAGLAPPLVGDAEPPPRGAWLGRPLALSALAAAALGSCGLLLLGAWPPRAPRGDAPPPRPAGLVDRAEPPCITRTGGTCHVFSCRAERSAECVAGRCVCAGGCAGADGTCRSDLAGYEMVASGVRLRNVRFGDQYLYAPRAWFMKQLRVTSSVGEYADEWDIYRVPGKAGKAFYMFSPVSLPRYAVGLANSGFLVTGLVRLDVVVEDMRSADTWDVVQSLCRSQTHSGAWEIDEGGAKWYVGHGSWEVFGWPRGGVGEGGLWAPEPAVNLSLPSCDE